MPNINFLIDDQGQIKNVSYDENMLVEDFMKDYISKNYKFFSLVIKVCLFRIGLKVLNFSIFKKKN
jgi:hypothetical protein